MVVLAVVGATVDRILSYRVSDTPANLMGLLLSIGAIVAALRVGGRLATSAFPDYGVAEVAVKGLISRDGSGGLVPGCGGGMPADDIVEQVDAVAGDDSVDAPLVRLDTPGGEVLSDDDIRRAVADFDGPMVAYVMDTCILGSYWIASGCDELWSHGVSAVDSIGVTDLSVNASELVNKAGPLHKRFAMGRYKDVGMALKEPAKDEREYLQGLTDDYYDDFVERVTEDCDMDPQVVCGTEAHVYLGEETHKLDSVSSPGGRGDVEGRLAECLGRDEVSVRKFIPEVGLTDRLRGGVEGTAYTFDTGLASSVDPDDGFSSRF